MIPKNIKKSHIIQAIMEIKRNGVAKRRWSRKYFLVYEGEKYPPKYVISLANMYASGTELDPASFNGGSETNNYLKERGFTIIEGV